MADIQVHCGSCGNEFNVTEDMAGLIATCPKCERQISVPLPDGIRESRPKLQMKKEETLSGGKRCPACNGSMAAKRLSAFNAVTTREQAGPCRRKVQG